MRVRRRYALRAPRGCSVVLPVPASPISTVIPGRPDRPYSRCVSASRCCATGTGSAGSAKIERPLAQAVEQSRTSLPSIPADRQPPTTAAATTSTAADESRPGASRRRCRAARTSTHRSESSASTEQLRGGAHVVLGSCSVRVEVLEQAPTRPTPKAEPAADAHQIERGRFGLNGRSGSARRIENLELLADLPAFEVGGDLRVLLLREQARVASSAASRSRASARSAPIRAPAPPRCGSGSSPIAPRSRCFVFGLVGDLLVELRKLRSATFRRRRLLLDGVSGAFAGGDTGARAPLRRPSSAAPRSARFSAHDVRMLRLSRSLQRLQRACAASSCCAAVAPTGDRRRRSRGRWATGAARASDSAASMSAIGALDARACRSRSRLIESISACSCISALCSPCMFASSCVGSCPCAAAVLLELLLVLDQPPARVFELRFEELIRPFGQHLTVAQVLVDEQRREPLGDPHRRARIVGT